MLARNLDWFGYSPNVLRPSTMIVRVHGAPAGNYTLVTWPGIFGALTAIAPGRFPLAVNYVQHRTASALWRTLGRGLSGYWPSTWNTGLALEKSRSYPSAFHYLSSEPLLAPIIYSLAGTERGRGVVIERTPDGYALRKLGEGNAVCATNYYVSPNFKNENVDWSDWEPRGFRPDRSYTFLTKKTDNSKVADPDNAIKLLSSPSLLFDFTQHQVVARPRHGMLVVRIPRKRPPRRHRKRNI
ncbi:MAG: hypothetical protein N2255_08990 [Kiritimatiellae bacterium]|nr:hypothetical protein [Kiritimatiellia bacterium]